jgi:ectoine hydroxylase-related dioxygenase (phytanoyl-CoA dioxygenase family)
MIREFSADSLQWRENVLRELKIEGVAVLGSVLPIDVCRELCDLVGRGLQIVEQEIGADRLAYAREQGVFRFPLKHFPQFLSLLENRLVNELVDHVIGKSAICHLMNAILLRPNSNEFINDYRDYFQSQFHRDFPRHLGGKPLSINTFYCLTDFSEENGSTRFILGSHQRDDTSPPESLGAPASVQARAGSVIVFDSTIWHAGGTNTSSNVRVGVNTQWTYHWIKQQIDLVRYLGSDLRSTFSPQVQQRLGFNSQVVTSLQEYYVSEEKRIYQSGQG